MGAARRSTASVLVVSSFTLQRLIQRLVLDTCTMKILIIIDDPGKPLLLQEDSKNILVKHWSMCNVLCVHFGPLELVAGPVINYSSKSLVLRTHRPSVL